ncbi:hypothetical protein UlMin_005873 [Ulmus minor]
MENKQNPDFILPPGFRFHPSDEELIIYYLQNKVTSSPLPASIIADIDLYKYNPWELPDKAVFGDEEWFFFSPRDRKYPNGSRPNRAAGSGYWKATGTDKHILTSSGIKSIGVKKALVFYNGRPPKGVKTDWIMNEYRLLDTMIWSTASKRKGSMRLDDWVLCRIRKKSNNYPRNCVWEDRNSPTYENPSYFPKLDEPTSKNTTQNLETVIDYLYKDFPMLPYIFASQELPNCLERASTMSFQGRENPKSHEERSKKITGFSASPDSLFNQLIKNKSSQEHHFESTNLQPNKKITKIDQSSNTESSTMNCWDIDQSKFEAFNTNHDWTSNLLYPELSQLAFEVPHN